jgi:hypothetical protein
MESICVNTVGSERVRPAEDVRRCMAVHAALHAQRWQEEGQRGVFASPRFSFHQQFATRLLEDNQLGCQQRAGRGAL